MKKKEENAEFIKTLEMKDKNAAAIKVVSNSIKYIKKNGWQSDGWSGQGKQKAKKCLVGALLEGAGFAIKNGSTYCDIKGETCNADELLFGELPGLRKSAYKILNAHLDEYIEENKVKDKERTLKEKAYYAIKNPTLKQENAFYKSLEKIDNNETFMRVEDLKNKKLNKSDMNSADAISQSIQDFNDEVLYSQEKTSIAAKKPTPMKVKAVAAKQKIKKTSSAEIPQWVADLRTKDEVKEEQKNYVIDNDRFKNLEID